MIITCEKCGTRFNLDESLLDAAGSTVRCSRCQHTFTAFPPPLEPEFDTLEFDDTDFDEDEGLTEGDSQETFEFEKLELEAIDPDEIEIEFEEADTAAEEAPDLSVKLDLSEEPPSEKLDLEEKLSLTEEIDDVQEELELDERFSEDKEPDFDLAFDLDEKEPGTEELDLKTLEDSDPFKETPADDLALEGKFENDEQGFDGVTEFDETAMNENDANGPSDKPLHEPPPPRRPARASLIQPLDREDELTADEDTFPQKRSGVGLPVLSLLILFLLAGGGYITATFFGYKIPFLPEIQIPFIQQYLPEKTPESVSYPDPIPDQKSVTGRFITNDTAGELFIITGKIENPAQIPYRRIQVKGTLFQKEQKAAITQTAFCGNIIPEETLRTSPVEDLTAQLRNPSGAADINDKVMPGGTVPFMLVFSDLPQNLENFTVEVAGFENAAP